MAKRQIDFIGPSVQDLGIETNNNGKAKNSNSKNSNANKGNTEMKTQNILAPNDESEDIDIDNHSNANIGITRKTNSENDIIKKSYNTVQFKMIRDYLYAAIGDSDRAEIKLSVMGQELGINPKTLYKHLKTLRGTEFIITKLQYSTEIKRVKAI